MAAHVSVISLSLHGVVSAPISIMDKMAEEGRVVRLAIFSRLVALLLQVVFNALIRDYDSCSTLRVENGTLNWLFESGFGGFSKWDSVYFLKISKEGYVYEQYMAFFPFYPTLIRAVSQILPSIDEDTRHLVSGWIISNSSFIAAAFALYKLSQEILRDKHLAFITSTLFCFNPATVFMSTLYTESTFAFLEFSGLYFMEKGGVCDLFFASVFLGLGSATRSNGTLACGFVSHATLRAFVKELVTSTGLPKKEKNVAKIVYRSGAVLLKLIVLNFIILAPFLAYQAYGYLTYCSEGVQSKAFLSSWCSKSLPLSYTYIQQHYWNVGFLKYFELKQLPNFVLATPMVVLCSSAIYSYFGRRENFEALKSLGLKLSSSKITENLLKNKQATRAAYHNPRLFVYLVHLTFIMVFGVTSMHVQVVTRLIASSSPVVYWYSAHVIAELSVQKKQQDNSKAASLLIINYFLLYCILGIALHCNFYPWT